MLLQHIRYTTEIRTKNIRRNHPFFPCCIAKKILREDRPITEHLVPEAHQILSCDGRSKTSDNGFPEQHSRGNRLLNKYSAAIQCKHLSSLPLLTVPIRALSYPFVPGQKLSTSRSLYIGVHSRIDCGPEESADESQKHASCLRVRFG